MQSSARSLCGNRFNCRSDSLGGGDEEGQTNQGFFSCRFGSAVEYMGIDSRKSRARGFSSPAFLAILLFLKYAFYFMLF